MVLFFATTKTRVSNHKSLLLISATSSEVVGKVCQVGLTTCDCSAIIKPKQCVGKLKGLIFNPKNHYNLMNPRSDNGFMFCNTQVSSNKSQVSIFRQLSHRHAFLLKRTCRPRWGLLYCLGRFAINIPTRWVLFI